jgi:hypothetical protein
MRFNRLITAGSALVVAAGAAACDEGLTAVNRNPNEPEVVAPQYILADAQVQAIGLDYGTHGVWFGLYLNDIWPQHLAQIQYNDEDKYILRPGVLQNVWNTLYAGPLTNLRVLKELAAEDGVPNQGAVADILSQYIYQVLTDHWGPIPYSEALGGDAGVIAPKYDMQEEVYNGMLAALAADVQQIDLTGATPFEEGDLIYGGDMDAWRKFANSLRMRMAMRIVDVDAATAQSEFVAAYNSGGFTSNADNARLVWGTGINAQNAHYDVFVNQDRYDFVISATTVDTLKSLSDPRLEIYADPAPSDGEYRGLLNGQYPSEYSPKHVLADFSPIGSYFLQATTPSVMMSYSELLFLRAEAAWRGWPAGGTAADLYVQAITASLEQYGVSSAEIAAYLAQPRVAPSASSATLLEQIYLQKWIALYMNGPEAYAEVRRTDAPGLQLAENAEIDTYPTRITYPATEQQLNRGSYDAAVSSIGADELDVRLWWDVR